MAGRVDDVVRATRGLPVRRESPTRQGRYCDGATQRAGPGAAACLVFGMLSGMLPGITTAAAAEIKIGVVNVREVFARYKKAEDLQKADKEEFEPRRKEFERRQRELVRRDADLRQMAQKQGEEEEAAKWLRERKKLEIEDYLLKLDRRQFQRDVQAANERLMRRLWDDLAAACRRVARAEGHDLILRSYGSDRSATPKLVGKGPATDRERIEALQLDALLYVAPSMDITERVLEVLEKAYRRGIKLVPDDRDEDRDDDTDRPPEGGHG